MRVTMRVNGRQVTAEDVWEGESLLFVLRERLGLPGSKNACEQGECGSCTVYLDGRPVCACLVAAGQATGRDVLTVEGLAGPDGLDPVQQAFMETGAVQCGFCTPGLIVQAHWLLRGTVGAGGPPPGDAEIREALAGNLCRCTGYEKILDAVRLAAARMTEAGGAAAPFVTMRGGTQPVSNARARTIIIEGCAVATMDGTGPDDTGAEYQSGHLIVRDGRIAAVGPGEAPLMDGAVVVDGSGCLATPGLVNTHHHLYQWLTQGRAQQADLFGWLTELYPVWARITPDQVNAAATAGLAWLALTGCTTAADHHYVFPRNPAPDSGAYAGPLEAEIAAAAAVGLRFHPCRGSMDLGESRGGLPPDEAVETTGQALAATAAAIEAHHDPSPESMVRIAVGPCSPFSASEELMREAAALARGTGTRLHTHLAETSGEEDSLREKTGLSPAEFADKLGWLAADVWLAHCVHLDDAAIRRLAATGTGVAHCPSSNGRLGSGIAPVRKLLAAGVPVGLGVDGPSSGDAASMVGELRQALLAARAARRRRGRADRTAGAVDGDPGRCPLPGPRRRDRLAARRRARRRRAVAAGHPRERRDRARPRGRPGGRAGVRAAGAAGAAAGRRQPRRRGRRAAHRQPGGRRPGRPRGPEPAAAAGAVVTRPGTTLAPPGAVTARPGGVVGESAGRPDARQKVTGEIRAATGLALTRVPVRPEHLTGT